MKLFQLTNYSIETTFIETKKLPPPSLKKLPPSLHCRMYFVKSR